MPTDPATTTTIGQETRQTRTFHVGSLLWFVGALGAVTTVLMFLFLHHTIKPSLRQQNIMFALAALMFILGLVGTFGPRRWRPKCRTFPLILAGAGLLFIGSITWNKLFISYRDHTTYRREVFRDANYNQHAPLYGRPVKEKNRVMRVALIPVTIALGMGCWLAWRPRERLRSKSLVWQLIVFQIALTAALGYYSVRAGKATVARNVGRVTRTAEVRKYTSVSNMLRHYVSRMPEMALKDRHYPPGTALLWRVELTHGPKGLVLALLLLLPALSLLPLKGVCGELGFSPQQTGAAMALYSTGASVLIFPTMSRGCMTVFLLAMCVWLLIRGLKRGETWVAMLLGFFFATYMFCTFATYMVGIFMGLATVLALGCRLVSFGRVLKVVAVSIGVYVMCFWLLYLISGFNIVACFRMAMSLHLEQTGVGFDGVSRYLFRSTGGILAYLIAAGVPLSVLAYAAIAGVFREKVASGWAGVFCISVTCAIILSGFSGMSFMETERIWLFFCMPLAVAAGFELGRRMEQEGSLAFRGVVCLALVQACCYGIYVDQMVVRPVGTPRSPAVVDQE